MCFLNSCYAYVVVLDTYTIYKTAEKCEFEIDLSITIKNAPTTYFR